MADNAVQYDDANRTSVTLNPGGATTKITNLAAGDVTSTSAATEASPLASPTQIPMATLTPPARVHARTHAASRPMAWSPAVTTAPPPMAASSARALA